MKGSSPASRGPADSNRLGHMLRNLQDRVRALENRPNITIGGWKLFETEDGSLAATKDSVTTTLATLTPPEEAL